MALPMPIPHWLNVAPQDFAAAAQSGLNSGLAAARTWQAGMEESARLAQQQRLADLAAKVKEEDNQRNFILEQQRDMARQEYQRALITQRKAQTEEAAKTAQAKAQQAMQQYQTMQQLAGARRDAERQRLDLERERVKLAEKKLGGTADDAAMDNIKAGPPQQSEPDFLSKGLGVAAKAAMGVAGPALAWAKEKLTGPTEQLTPARQKAVRANAISALHPDWTKDQVIKAVNDEFGADSEPSDESQ